MELESSVSLGGREREFGAHVVHVPPRPEISFDTPWPPV